MFQSPEALAQALPPFLSFGIAGYEWVIILIVALLLFGTRLPAVARSMGKGISEFKKGLKEDAGDDPEAKPPARAPEADEKR